MYESYNTCTPTSSKKIATRVFLYDAHALDRNPPLTSARDTGAHPRFFQVHHSCNGDDGDGQRAGRSDSPGWQRDRKVGWNCIYSEKLFTVDHADPCGMRLPPRSGRGKHSSPGSIPSSPSSRSGLARTRRHMYA